MPKRIGNARATTDKRLGVLLKLQILGLVVAQPQLVAIVVTSLAESYAELQRLKARASQAWPEEYNNKEVELGSAALFPHVFEATVSSKPAPVLDTRYPHSHRTASNHLST